MPVPLGGASDLLVASVQFKEQLSVLVDGDIMNRKKTQTTYFALKRLVVCFETPHRQDSVWSQLGCP